MVYPHKVLDINVRATFFIIIPNWKTFKYLSALTGKCGPTLQSPTQQYRINYSYRKPRTEQKKAGPKDFTLIKFNPSNLTCQSKQVNTTAQGRRWYDSAQDARRSDCCDSPGFPPGFGRGHLALDTCQDSWNHWSKWDSSYVPCVSSKLIKNILRGYFTCSFALLNLLGLWELNAFCFCIYSVPPGA